MKILHIDLKIVGKDYVEFRYFWDNPNQYRPRRLPYATIEVLIDKSETDYYTILPEDYTKTGQALFDWLDGTGRIFQNAIDPGENERDKIIIAIASKGLAHLPWELLHDGTCFLVEKTPSIIPVRWLSNNQPIKFINQPQNRPLNLLFMATSPLGVKPELDYEAEEKEILEATNRTPVDLRVEESGCLRELEYVVKEYEKGHFDIFHLTGHATYEKKKPCFLTEDEFGNLVYSSTAEIYDALQNSLSPLIFLSGCRTGYSSDDGVVPSMAEELLNMGATVVLGWGGRVRDTDAKAAASTLYGQLSQGGTIPEALSFTYKTLIEHKVRDWHKLRLYVANTLPEQLVTPLKTRGRIQLPKPTTTQEFRDDEKRLRVASRADFVGRRRQLQNCLRTLKTDDDKVGVLIHGMGGWGKSSITSRLWDRLPEYKKVLWWRQIDKSNLISKLSSKLTDTDLRKIRNDLNNNDDSLEIKLANLFRQLPELGESPFLLILDDFEWNLEYRAGRYILNPEVARILKALVETIQDTGTAHRIIITSRYKFDSDLLDSFFIQGLEPLKGAELTKKLNRLEHFCSGRLSKKLLDWALKLADGNPRLLEFLNNKVLILDEQGAELKLTELEQSPELRDKIIWSELYQHINEPLQQLLSYCLIYELPVPIVALEAVCESLPDYQQQLQRGINWGLTEINSEVKKENRVYLISRILPHIIANIQLPVAPHVYVLYRKAYEKLHQLWGNKENRNEERWQEIFRLLFADQDNLERFRQGFSQMLAAQFNQEAANAFKSELRKCTSYSVADELLLALKNYLQQQQWREADEETAWIFYQIMVKENYENWEEVLENFPCETLQQINQLWLKNSKNRFGISIQSDIYHSLGGTSNYEREVWEKFCEHVGWQNCGECLKASQVYNEVCGDTAGATARSSQLPLYRGCLPVLIYSKELGSLLTRTYICNCESISLFSRAETCKVLH